MQVYRGMDIGTAKPDLVTTMRFDYRMVDVADPEEEYGASRFQADGRAAIGEITAANRQRCWPGRIVLGEGGDRAEGGQRKDEEERFH